MSQPEKDYLDAYLRSLKEKTAKELPWDEFFEQFCADQILKERDLDLTEKASGRVRGMHDGGIDSIYLFVNGRLIQDGSQPSDFKRQRQPFVHLTILQATQTDSFEEDRIRKFSTTTGHLLDPKHSDLSVYEDRYNISLRKAVQSFKNWWNALIPQLPRLKITFYYAAKASSSPHPNVKGLADDLESQVKALYPCECNVEFVNAGDLLSLAQRSVRGPLPLRFDESLGWTKTGVGYICLVPLQAYVEFITGEDGQRREYILAPNVRGYLGDKGVNEGIRSTLSGSQTTEFWWLNNGVTIVASKIHPSSRELVLEEPRIVNGLQTSREIYEYSKAKSVDGDPRHIVVKVIETSDKDTFNTILKTTNSQTKIDKVYFHGMEEIHEKIDLAFPAFGLFYERQKNQYFDDASHDRDKIITLPYLIQALIAIVLRSPDQARGRPSSFGEKEYSKMFRKSDRPELYANAALLMKNVERFLQSRTPPIDRSDQYNLKFYIAMYAACTILKDAEPYRSKLSQLFYAKATDTILDEALVAVSKRYAALSKDEEPDLVAKGTKLLTEIQRDLSAKYRTKQKRATSRGRKPV